MTKSPGPLVWTVWSVGAIGFFYAFFQRVGPSIMVGELMADFGVSAALLGNLSALYFYAYASLQIPIGVMVDRWGPRRLMTIAWLFAGAGSLLFAAADTLEAAYLGRFLIGVGSAFFFVCSLKIAAVWFPVERFALMGGMTLMAGMAGGVGGQAPTAWAVGAFGWRPTMAAAGAFAFVFAIVCWTVVRDRPAVASRETGTRAWHHTCSRGYSRPCVNPRPGCWRPPPRPCRRRCWRSPPFGGYPI